MGSASSSDTRRISFDNTFSSENALLHSKSLQDNNGLEIDNLPTLMEKDENLMLLESNKTHENITKAGVEQQYWANRIEYLKKEHRLINQIIESEYKRTLENSSNILIDSDLSPEKIESAKPCYEWRAKVMQCYENNPRQPLLCAPIIQEFSECVSASRTRN